MNYTWHPGCMMASVQRLYATISSNLELGLVNCTLARDFNAYRYDMESYSVPISIKRVNARTREKIKRKFERLARAPNGKFVKKVLSSTCCAHLSHDRTKKITNRFCWRCTWFQQHPNIKQSIATEAGQVCLYPQLHRNAGVAILFYNNVW